MDRFPKLAPIVPVDSPQSASSIEVKNLPRFCTSPAESQDADSPSSRHQGSEPAGRIGPGRGCDRFVDRYGE